VPLFPRRPLAAYPLQFGLALGLMPHVPCEVDKFLAHGDRLGPLQVIHTPGHSPGHLALLWQEKSVLFAGDTLATWPYLSLGWPGLNLNAKQHLRTLHDLVDLDVSIIAVGHGEPAIDEQTEVLRRLIRRS
jgi:glyoxylase-like metal-dependent hydrolase (beta-lactamase superfamily II)